jgi:hypothetical protein
MRKSTSTPHVVLGSSVVSYGVVDIPLRLEGSSRTCVGRLGMAVLLDVSDLATANAKLVVKMPFLLQSKLVDPVHAHSVDYHRADVAVRWKIMSTRNCENRGARDSWL